MQVAEHSRPRVLAEVRELLPLNDPVTRDELRESIRAEGCRHPLVVWRQGNVLLDGHTRLELCEELGLPYRLLYVDLPDIGAAQVWVLQNQLGRRNLNSLNLAYLRGCLYLTKRGDRSANLLRGRRARHASPAPGASSGVPGTIEGSGAAAAAIAARAAERVARMCAVSRATIERDCVFAQRVDEIEQTAGPRAREAVLASSRLTRVDVQEIADRRLPTLSKVLGAIAALEAARATRRPSEGGVTGFFQRAVRSVEVRTDPDGREYLDSATLSCGHRYRYKRRRLAEASDPKSHPCAECGSGTRRQAEIRRYRATLQARLRAIAETEPQLELLVEFVTRALERCLSPASIGTPQEEERERRLLEIVDALKLPRPLDIGRAE